MIKLNPMQLCDTVSLRGSLCVELAPAGDRGHARLSIRVWNHSRVRMRRGIVGWQTDFSNRWTANFSTEIYVALA